MLYAPLPSVLIYHMKKFQQYIHFTGETQGTDRLNEVAKVSKPMIVGRAWNPSHQEPSGGLSAHEKGGGLELCPANQGQVHKEMSSGVVVIRGMLETCGFWFVLFCF